MTAASSLRGASRGRKAGNGNQPSRAIKRGIKPARTSEDLPLPDAPRTSAKRGAAEPCRRMLSIVSMPAAISVARPKKIAASSSLKDIRLGYGGRFVSQEKTS